MKKQQQRKKQGPGRPRKADSDKSKARSVTLLPELDAYVQGLMDNLRFDRSEIVNGVLAEYLQLWVEKQVELSKDKLKSIGSLPGAQGIPGATPAAKSQGREQQP